MGQGLCHWEHQLFFSVAVSASDSVLHVWDFCLYPSVIMLWWEAKPLSVSLPLHTPKSHLEWNCGLVNRVVVSNPQSPGFDPQHHTDWMWWHVCNPRTQEVETGGSGVQGHLWLHGGFETSLGYLSAYVSFPWTLWCVFFCAFFLLCSGCLMFCLSPLVTCPSWCWGTFLEKPDHPEVPSPGSHSLPMPSPTTHPPFSIIFISAHSDLTQLISQGACLLGLGHKLQDSQDRVSSLHRAWALIRRATQTHLLRDSCRSGLLTAWTRCRGPCDLNAACPTRFATLHPLSTPVQTRIKTLFPFKVTSQ